MLKLMLKLALIWAVSYYPECLANGWVMLNSVVSIGEIFPKPRPPVAPPRRQLVLLRSWLLAVCFVRLWVLLSDCRSVTLLPPPLALSHLSPSHYFSASGLLLHHPSLTHIPYSPSLLSLPPVLCAPARVWADWGPLDAIGRHSWASVRIFF